VEGNLATYVYDGCHSASQRLLDESLPSPSTGVSGGIADKNSLEAKPTTRVECLILQGLVCTSYPRR